MDLAQLQEYITNSLPPIRGYFAGIIGDRPSAYAKSPVMWDAAFRHLEIDAVYLPFDVDEERLPALVSALRRHHRYLGGNVTIPYKRDIMDLLDGLDQRARQIGAVNTVVRTPDGQLVGYNTDGSGALYSLTQPVDGEPFLPAVEQNTVLLIGAGGSARAVGIAVAEAIGPGRLLISNRSHDRAQTLAESVGAAFGNASALLETEIEAVAEECDLVINATTRGQAGLRKLAQGVTYMEPYSALAPAHPAVLPGEVDDALFYRTWFEASRGDIRANQMLSLEVVGHFRKAAFFDLIYAPPETVMLRHARWSGHRTLNGRWMNIAQAADALVYKVCRRVLEERGELDAIFRGVLEVMASAH